MSEPNGWIHNQVAELLSAYIDGEVTAAERGLVEAHLASCDACGRDLATLRQELSDALQLGIQTLPPDQRATLVLSDVQGFSYQEIADMTGVSLGTVKSRLSRARARLRDYLITQQELLPAQYRLVE